MQDAVPCWRFSHIVHVWNQPLPPSQGDPDSVQHMEGQHSWFSCSHARPTYCNVCRETLHGVAWHGLSCEVCKFKSHRRCVFYVEQPCKWTTRSNLEKDGVHPTADVSTCRAEWCACMIVPLRCCDTAFVSGCLAFTPSVVLYVEQSLLMSEIADLSCHCLLYHILISHFVS